MMKPFQWRSLTAAALALMLLLGAANLFLGNLNQDEGWYLYAARQVAEGRVLYRDTLFTQGPALPYIYGALFPVIEKLGLAGGRLISFLFGLAAAGCAVWLAARAAGRSARTVALCALILTGVNVYQSCFTTIVKTYSLSAFFLTAGFVALSYVRSRRGGLCACLGGALLALAASTRLSAGIALPVGGLWLIFNRRHVVQHAWLFFGAGGGLVLLAGFGPFFIVAPEAVRFALFGYHAGRLPGGLMEMAALKAGFISRFVQAYFVFSAGCVLAFIFRRHHPHVPATADADWDVRPRLTELLQQANQQESTFSSRFISLLWAAGAAVSLVHFAAPFPYDDYQVVVYPLLVAALAATLVPRCPEKFAGRLVPALLLVCTAASLSSPLNQEWMVRGRDRIWWKFKETPDLLALRNTGALIRNELGENGLLLTQDTYLAVEAGARVPEGMEMGPFCYYPDMPRERAEKLNLLNRDMMLELIEAAPAPLAAFSGYGLSIASPEIKQINPDDQRRLRAALEANYKKTGEVPNFGQAHTTLELFERRK
jgi:hypothetical protein